MKKALKNYLKKLQENKEKGFSLVELIIVMAIMAILVGVVASQVIPYMEKSRQAKDQQQLSSIGTTIVTAITDSAKAIPDTGIGATKLEDMGSTDLGTEGEAAFVNLMGADDIAAVQSNVAGKFKSSEAKKTNTIYFSVAADGTVRVWVGANTYDTAPAKLKIETE